MKTLDAIKNILNGINPFLTEKKKILIFLVDDNALYLKDLELQFKMNEDLTIKTFPTGEECLKSLSENPDIIVLDYFLDSVTKDAVDGLKILLLIKNASPTTQVIISSGNEEVLIAVDCIKQGASDYVVKDKNTFEELKKSIKRIFGVFSKEKELIVWDW